MKSARTLLPAYGNKESHTGNVMPRPPTRLLRSIFDNALQRFNESGERKALLSPRKRDSAPKSADWGAVNEPVTAGLILRLREGYGRMRDEG
jgi:hypothetical protein